MHTVCVYIPTNTTTAVTCYHRKIIHSSEAAVERRTSGTGMIGKMLGRVISGSSS